MCRLWDQFPVLKRKNENKTKQILKRAVFLVTAEYTYFLFIYGIFTKKTDLNEFKRTEVVQTV